MVVSKMNLGSCLVAMVESRLVRRFKSCALLMAGSFLVAKVKV